MILVNKYSDDVVFHFNDFISAKIKYVEETKTINQRLTLFSLSLLRIIKHFIPFRFFLHFDKKI